MNINTLYSTINEIPTSEIKYYLLLLVSALKERQVTKSPFIDELQLFADQIKTLLLLKDERHINSKTSNSIDTIVVTQYIQDIHTKYQTLLNLSKTNTLGVKIGYALLNIGGVIAAVICGVIGGLIGGVAGLARGLWNIKTPGFDNPIKSAGIGVVMGISIGALIGFRAPKKLAKDVLTRQLKFCLDGLANCIHNFKMSDHKPLSAYEKTVIEKYFNNNEDDFIAFKKQERVTYTIETLKATFISPTLENYLGHHAFIKILIDNERPPVLIEFNSSPSELTQQSHQYERREAAGGVLVQMMLLHEQLQLTQACTKKYILTTMKPGDTDCFSYVNQILTGSGQKAASVQRFDGTENWVGRNVTGFFITRLSPFAQDALNKVQASSAVGNVEL